MIRNTVRIIFCILFSTAILAGCAKTTEIVTMPPLPTATQVPMTKTLSSPTNMPAIPTPTLESYPTESSATQTALAERVLVTSDGTTELVSIASDGIQGNRASYNPAISADGRYVVFDSDATNLVEGVAIGSIFVHDRVTGETTVVSISSDGTQKNGGDYPAISADGRYVTFTSHATNQVNPGAPGTLNIFVHDRVTGETRRVSVASDGTQGNGISEFSSISADGRYVVFTSEASNLVDGDTNGERDIFVHDRVTGETRRVSVASNGTQGNKFSIGLSISTNGRYIAFASEASNLVDMDTNGVFDVFVYDGVTEETTRVSVASDGAQGNESSYYPSISGDGRYVAFFSDASNLMDGDTNGGRDVFVHDRVTGETQRVSGIYDSMEGFIGASGASISANGRYVAFTSHIPNPGESTGMAPATDWYIYVYDRVTEETTMVSVSSDGRLGNGVSFESSISADGRFVVFGSEADNLVGGDTNGVSDIFVRDLGTSK